MDPLATITVIFGAILALLGIFAFLKKGTQGTSRIRMLGAEFELGGSALVIFVVGAMLIVVPWIYSGRQKAEPAIGGVGNTGGDTSTKNGSDSSNHAGKTVSGIEVPSVQDKTLSTAATELAESGLRIEIRREESQRPAEIVLRQEPPGGQIVEPNSVVIVTIPDSVVTVPDVKGQPLTQAIVALTQKGLKIGPQRSQIDGSGGVGTVLDQVPRANDKVAVGTEVQLIIKGAAVTVPRVTEIAWEIARDNVASAGLTVAAQWDESSNKPSGIVLLQRPPQGSQVAPGSEVVLTVAGKTPSINLSRVRLLSSIRSINTHDLRTIPGKP